MLQKYMVIIPAIHAYCKKEKKVYEVEVKNFRNFMAKDNYVLKFRVLSSLFWS